MKRATFSVLRALKAFGRLLLLVPIEGTKAHQKYAWTATGVILELITMVAFIAIILIAKAAFTGDIQDIPYKVELIQAILIASATITSLCAVFIGAIKFGLANAKFRIFTIPLNISLIIGLLTITFSVSWLIIANDRFLAIVLVLFTLQICAFCFGLSIIQRPD